MNQTIIPLLSLCSVLQLYANNSQLMHVPKHDIIKSISVNNIDCHLALEEFNKTTDKKNSLVGYIIGDLLIKEEGILNISHLVFDDFFDLHTVNGRNVIVLKDHKISNLLQMNFDQDHHCTQLVTHAIENRKNFDLQYESICDEYCSLNSDALKNFFHDQYTSTQSANNNSLFKYNENSCTFNFKYVQTSGAGALCSFASILNYVKDMHDSGVEFKDGFAKEVNELAQKHQYHTNGEAQEELRNLVADKVKTFDFDQDQTKASQILFKYLTSILTPDICGTIIAELTKNITESDRFYIEILNDIKTKEYTMDRFDKDFFKFNAFICSKCLPYISYNDPYMIQLVSLMMHVPCNVFEIDKDIEYANSKNMFDLRKTRSYQFRDDKKAFNVLLDNNHFTYLKAVDSLCIEGNKYAQQIAKAKQKSLEESRVQNNSVHADVQSERVSNGQDLSSALKASLKEEQDRAKKIKKEEDDLALALRKSLEESNNQGDVKNNAGVKVNESSTFVYKGRSARFTHTNTPNIGNLCSFAILSDYMKDMKDSGVELENEFAKKVMKLAEAHEFNTKTETNGEKDGKLQKELRNLIASEIKNANLSTIGDKLANEYIAVLLDNTDRPSKGMYAKLPEVIAQLEGSIKVLEGCLTEYFKKEKGLPKEKRIQSIETLEKLQSDRKTLKTIKKVSTDGYEDSNNIDGDHANDYQLISALLPYTTMNSPHIIRLTALMMGVNCNIFLADQKSGGENNEFDIKLSSYDLEHKEELHADTNTLNVLLYNENNYTQSPNHYTYLKATKIN